MTKAEVTRLCKKHKITSRKSGGDDQYSWSVFHDGVEVYGGCMRSELDHLRRMILRRYGYSC